MDDIIHGNWFEPAQDHVTLLRSGYRAWKWESISGAMSTESGWSLNARNKAKYDVDCLGAPVGIRERKLVKCGHPAEGPGRLRMRRFIIPLVFVALLTIAAVVPVAADGGGSGGSHPGGCDYSDA